MLYWTVSQRNSRFAVSQGVLTRVLFIQHMPYIFRIPNIIFANQNWIYQGKCLPWSTHIYICCLSIICLLQHVRNIYHVTYRTPRRRSLTNSPVFCGILRSPRHKTQDIKMSNASFQKRKIQHNLILPGMLNYIGGNIGNVGTVLLLWARYRNNFTSYPPGLWQ